MGNYKRFLMAFGDASGLGRSQKFLPRMEKKFDMSFVALKDELEVAIALASEELRTRPLSEYREQKHLRTAWELTTLPAPLPFWNFLTDMDPAEAGIWLPEGSWAHPSLSEDTLEPLDLFGDSVRWGGHITALWLVLARYRRVIRCLWAGIIIETMVHSTASSLSMPQLKRGDDELCDVKAVQFAENFFRVPQMDRHERIGRILDFARVSDEQVAWFREFERRASFGSGSCEHSVALVFQEWLRNTNIGMLQRYGLSCEVADTLLLAGSQRAPKATVELLWSAGTYRFSYRIYNLDACGYPDAAKNVRIPDAILFDIFKSAPEKSRKDFVRLFVRGAMRMAEDLAMGSFDID